MAPRLRLHTLWVLMAVAIPLRAQEPGGSVEGRMLGRDDAPATGAEVLLRDPRTGESAAHTSVGRDGHYALTIAPGEYAVVVRSPRATRTQALGTVKVRPNTRTTIDAVLDDSRGWIERRRPPVDIGGASSLGTLELEELPLINRNFTDLVPLLPGVSSDLGDEVLFGARGPLLLSITGGRASAVSWQLDRASIAHPGTLNGVVITPSMDSIQGVDVHTGAFDAARRGGGGGIIGIVTRSGGDRYSGTAFGFFRNDGLRADTLVREIVRPAQGLPSHVEYNRKDPRLRDSDAGFTVGGPAVPGRRLRPLHFFVSEEWWRRSGQLWQTDSVVPDPAWLTDPASANYVAPADRDPNAVKLLAAWPAPNVPGTNRYRAAFAAPDDARQDTLRLDYAPGSAWRLMGRYQRHGGTELAPSGYPTQGRALTVQSFNTSTDVSRVGRVAGLDASMVRGGSTVQLSYELADHRLRTTPHQGIELRRDVFGIDIPEMFPSNTGGRIPSIFVEGLTGTWSPQPPNLLYRAHEVGGEVTVERGTHTIETGALVDVEEDDEDSDCQAAPGVFYFASSPQFSGFQNFLRGNRDQSCPQCRYNEDQIEPKNRFRFGRYDLYLQDAWRATDRLTLEVGLRYSLFPPIRDDFNRLLTFAPATFDPGKTPAFADPWGDTVVPGTGDPLNGIYLAGQTSPYGDAVHAWDTNNVQPRVAVSWKPTAAGGTIIRAALGTYFDRVPARMFASQYLDPLFPRQVGLVNAPLSDPSRGLVEDLGDFGEPVPDRRAVASPLVSPRTDRWTVGVSHRLYERGTIDMTYVGARGHHQVRPIDINQPQPTQVDPEQPWIINPLRPYPGYGSIVLQETTGRSRYDGLLTSFRYRAGRAGSFTINYTLSRAMADASEGPGCDCQFDQPQNPLDKNADYSLARTDRTHVLAGFYVLELPFFREDPRGWLRHTLGGWQVAGITRISSGPPGRVIYVTDSARLRTDLVGDPGAGRQHGHQWFDNAAFVPPARGAYGTAPVSPFRLPGQQRWDLAVSKNFYWSSSTRLQVRADIVNLFNSTQDNSVYPYCYEGIGCEFAGEVMSFRTPREVRVGAKLFW